MKTAPNHSNKPPHPGWLSALLLLGCAALRIHAAEAFPRPQVTLDGIVIGFCRHCSPFSAYAYTLRRIDPNAAYAVSAGYEPEPPLRISGVEFQ